MNLARQHVFASAALTAEQHGSLRSPRPGARSHQPDHRGTARLEQRGFVDGAAQRAISARSSLDLAARVRPGAGSARARKAWSRSRRRPPSIAATAFSTVHRPSSGFTRLSGRRFLISANRSSPLISAIRKFRQHQVERRGFDQRARLAAAFGGSASRSLAIGRTTPGWRGYSSSSSTSSSRGHQASRDAGSWTTNRLARRSIASHEDSPAVRHHDVFDDCQS